MRSLSAGPGPRPQLGPAASSLRHLQHCTPDLKRLRVEKYPREVGRRSSCSTAIPPKAQVLYEKHAQDCIQQKRGITSTAIPPKAQVLYEKHAQDCIQQKRGITVRRKTKRSESDGGHTVNQVSSIRHGKDARLHPQSPPAVRTARGVSNLPNEENVMENEPVVCSEQTPLIDAVQMAYGTREASACQHVTNAAVVVGGTHTTWQTEARLLGRHASPLVLASLLQHSLLVTSVLTVGRLGRVELAAVSLATMTANITAYSVHQGLATSLDTIAAQAYGSGRKKLVGLHLQRMVYFLWAVSIPIAAIWTCSNMILEAIVPDKETAQLAGAYLKIATLGIPGYAAFESGKRFVQAQGLFSATLYCLLVCAPINAALNYIFVWRLEWGFIGAPIAVSITQTLLPLCLICYVYFIKGRECWGGFDRRAFQNWGPMIKLAVPGLVTFLAEFLAFEILTLAAARLGTTALAAQSILTTVMAITFQLPFPIAVSASTRVASLTGAMLPVSAKVAAAVAITAATLAGLLNATLLSCLPGFISRLFTQDDTVVAVASKALPICAALQVFDALASNLNGVLRGLGRQEIGGYVGVTAFYVIGIPISFGTGFGLQWGLSGLWAGPVAGLAIVSIAEAIIVYSISWQRACEEARRRNLQEDFCNN